MIRMSVLLLIRVYPQEWRSICGWISKASKPADLAVWPIINHTVR